MNLPTYNSGDKFIICTFLQDLTLFGMRKDGKFVAFKQDKIYQMDAEQCKCLSKQGICWFMEKIK